MFSGKKIYTSSVSTLPLMPDEKENRLTTAVFMAIFEGTSIVDNIIQVASSGLGVDIDKYISYGKKKYIFGLPSGKLTETGLDRHKLNKLFQRLEGTYIEPVRYGNVPLEHYGKVFLRENLPPIYTAPDGARYGYDGTYFVEPYVIPTLPPKVKVCTTVEGEEGPVKVCTLEQPPAPDTIIYRHQFTETIYRYRYETVIYYGDTYGFEKITYEVPNSIAILYDRYKINLTKGTSTFISSESYEIPLVDLNKIYYYGEAIFNKTPGQVTPFMFDIEDPQYEELKEVEDTSIDIAQFMPIAVLKKDFKNVSDHEYSSVKGLLDTVNIPIDGIIEQLDSNEGAQYIKGAYVLFGTNMFSKNQYDLAALYQFFGLLAGATTTNAYFNVPNHVEIPNCTGEANRDFPDCINTHMPPNINSLSKGEHSFTIEESTFRLDLIYKEVSVSREYGRYSSYVKVGDYASEWKAASDPYYPDGNVGAYWRPDTVTVNDGSYTLIYQNTEEYYTKIHIEAPLYAYSLLAGERYQTIYHYITNEPDYQEMMIIPLSIKAIESLPKLYREKVLQRALHLVIYSQQVTKLKWYETSFFLFLVQAILLVVGAYHFYLGIQSAMAAAVKAAITQVGVNTITVATLKTIALKAAAYYIAGAVIKSIVIKLALGFLVKKLEAEVALLVILVGYISYTGYTTGKIGLPSVKELMSFVDITTEAVNIDTAIKNEAIADEYESWYKTNKERQEELDNAYDMLNTNNSNIIDYLDITRVTTNMFTGETASQFYERALTTNPGAIAIQSVSDYYDNMLKLPKNNISLPYISDIDDRLLV